MKITDLYREYNVPYKQAGEHEHARPGWVQTDCPYCGPGSGHYRLGFNLYGRYFSCWFCGPQRRRDCLSEILGIPLGASAKIFGEIEQDRQFAKLPDSVRGKLKLPPDVGKLQMPHKLYLKERRFDPNHLQKEWGIQGLGAYSGRYNWRIFIPVEFDGEIVSWTTRSISKDVKQRYLAAPMEMERFNAKKLLYGEDHCRHSCIVCEGATDVWRLGKGAVATLGTAVSTAQIQRISKFTRRAICFDNSPEAQRRADALCDKLSLFDGETFKVILDAPDPGSAKLDEVRKLRKLLA